GDVLAGLRARQLAARGVVSCATGTMPQATVFEGQRALIGERRIAAEAGVLRPGRGGHEQGAQDEGADGCEQRDPQARGPTTAVEKPSTQSSPIGPDRSLEGRAGPLRGPARRAWNRGLRAAPPPSGPPAGRPAPRT